MRDKEQELFDAIYHGKAELVIKIISEEESHLHQGNLSIIRPNAQDNEENTFCHYAAKNGTNAIINKILFSRISFAYDLPNNQGKLPEELCWSGRYKDRLPKRKIKQEDQDLYGVYQRKVEEIRNQEISGGYKKGIIFTSDFNLSYNSKKYPDRKCLIPDYSELEHFSIHDRQALDEAIWANRVCLEKGQWQESPPYLEAENYQLVNIGFVTTLAEYQKRSQSMRHFYSMPLFLSEKMGTGLTVGHRHGTSGHTEINLYDLLLDPDNLPPILDYFKRLYQIPSEEKRKIYACVIDIHSSQDACDDCELNTYSFELFFTDLIKTIAPKSGFEVSKSCPTIVRESSSRPSSGAYRKKNYQRLKEPHIYQDFIARTYTPTEPMDLKKSELPFMLHYDENTRDSRGVSWYKRNTIFSNEIKNIPPRTVFFTSERLGQPYHNPAFPENYEIKRNEDFPRLLQNK